MTFGFWEIMLLLLIVLIVFGAGRLPQAMGDVGKSWRAFRAGMSDEAGGEPRNGPRRPPLLSDRGEHDGGPERGRQGRG